MQLTNKKKVIIASALVRDTHLLLLAISFYQSLYKDLKPQVRGILGEQATKELGDIFSKGNFINNILLEMYKNEENKDVKTYLKDANGLNHIEEMSMLLLESLQEIQKTYKPKNDGTK